MKKDIREYLNIKTLLLVLLVALVIFIPAWGNRRYMNIAILVLMYIGLGESWNLLSGMSGLFSIAHALFFGLGVYGMTIGMTKLGLPVVGGILLGLAANLVMALIVGFVGSKLSGLYFTMALIALHAIIYTLAGQLSFTGYALGLSMPREYLMSRHALYFLVLGLAALMMLIFVWVRKSRIGTNFVALKENPDLAVSLGSNIRGWRILAVIISAMMASIMGAFYAFYMMANTPEVFASTISLRIIMVCMVGGLGNVWGPVMGCWLIVFDELVRGIMPSKFASFAVVVYALVLIVMALLKPKGIMGSKIFQPKETDARRVEHKKAGAKAQK